MILNSLPLREPTQPAPIDFRRSLPPAVPAVATHLSIALERLARHREPGSLMRQSIARGTEEDRAAGAALLEPRLGRGLDLTRICVTNGTQNTLLLLMRALIGREGVLLAERLTYGALPPLVRMAEVRVSGVAIDEQGIVPDALESACRKLKPKALYCNPTAHNPTTATMSAARRTDIVEVARRHGVAILEDDALGRLHPDSPPPIASIAPDITWYVMTMTKCLAQGLRVAYLVVPHAPAAQSPLTSFEHLSHWHAAPLSSAIVHSWVKSGAADEITAHISKECVARERCAREILNGLNHRGEPGSMHIWIDLPEHISTAAVVRKAEERGLLLRGADVFAIEAQTANSGLRLSLSSPETIEQVREGVGRLRELLSAMF